MLTSEALKEALDYNPDTGIFTWRHRDRVPKTINTRFAGKPAGRVNVRHGYLELTVNYVMYRAHRLAWLYMTNEWPTDEIDHINRDKLDNRFCNLREATRSINSRNRAVMSNSQTGVKHVSYDSRLVSPYRVRIRRKGQKINFGSYDTIEEAKAVAEKATISLE